MANWTIRSKTEKTSLAATDGVPMQEAGGTTKWFSLTSLAAFLGISDGVSNISKKLYNNYISSGDGPALMTLGGPGNYTVSSDCTGMPVDGFNWIGFVYGFYVDGSNQWEFVTVNKIGTLEVYQISRLNGSWGSWKKITQSNGNPNFPVVATTASAANAYIAGSDNTILQSTSSAKYKTDIRDLEDTSTLDALRPVLYKSNPETVPGDDPTLDHYGFIAEELHEIDEKLVQYKEDESGEKTPNGVQYDRVVVLLVKRIQELEARLAKAGI